MPLLPSAQVFSSSHRGNGCNCQICLCRSSCWSLLVKEFKAPLAWNISAARKVCLPSFCAMQGQVSCLRVCSIVLLSQMLPQFPFANFSCLSEASDLGACWPWSLFAVSREHQTLGGGNWALHLGYAGCQKCLLPWKRGQAQFCAWLHPTLPCECSCRGREVPCSG